MNLSIGLNKIKEKWKIYETDVHQNYVLQGGKLNIKKNILIGTIRSIIGAMVHTIIPNRCKWEQFPAQQYNQTVFGSLF